jgi:hypothetical protein
MYLSEWKSLVLSLKSDGRIMRAFGRVYFYISGGVIENTKDYGNEKDDENYRLGNYFLDSTQAKKVLETKEYKRFWELVRSGQIGG